MAKKFRDLVKATMTPERQARASKRARAMRGEMHLADLRRARELSQAELAEKLGVAQSEVSKVERRTDLYLSTLKKYIEAAGGRLEIVAHFPDADVRISQFESMAAKD
jgi:DNA-binding transcriptional regulator YiaG